MIESNTIGARIRELRCIKHETQADLAKALNVLRATINQWENETRDLKTQYTVSLADHFETTCDYILRGIKPENVSVYQKTGLTDEAIDNIISITSAYHDPNTIASTFPTGDKNITIKVGGNITKKTYTLETGDLLNEFLSSNKLQKLIEHISYLTREYAEVKEVTPILNKIRGVNSPGEFTDRFHYKLWRANTTAQTLISEVLENYYLKTKNGVKTYRAIEILSNDGSKRYKMVQIVKGLKDEGDSDGQH